MNSFEKNYYLYDCHLNRDIENNIGEIIIPEFTMENIIMIDQKYKKYYIKVIQLSRQNNLFNEVELAVNELYMEHMYNIKMLTTEMNEYNTFQHMFTSNNELTPEERVNRDMYIRSKQIRMYFEDILPRIENSEEHFISLTELYNEITSERF
mgnify:CR=1 FL=1|jgi:hypothetical protein